MSTLRSWPAWRAARLAIVVLALTMGARALAAPLMIRAKTRLSTRAEKVERGMRLTGVLQDDSRAAVPSETVFVAIGEDEEIACSTDREGRFEVFLDAADLRGIQDRYGRLVEWSARFEGDSRYGSARAIDRLDLDRTPTWLELEVTPERTSLDAPSAVVSVAVRAASGPVADAPVRIRVGEGPELLGHCNGHGRARFLIRPGLLERAGRYPVRARYLGDHRFGGSDATAELRIYRSTRLTLRVGREGDPATGRYRFSGRLADGEGPVGGGTIAILVDAAGAGSREAPDVTLAVTSEDGVYLTALDARRLFGDARGMIEVRAAYRPSDELHLPSTSPPIAIPVPPPPGVPVRWYIAGLLWALAGVATAHALRNRVWEDALLWLRHRRRERGKREPPSGRPEEVPFILEARSSDEPACADRVSGVVIDAHGATPIPGVRVVIEGPAAEHCTRTTGPRGRFSSGPLSPGQWHLRMEAEGYMARAAVLSLPHSGNLDGATFALVAVRRRIRDIYGTTLRRLGGDLRWGRDTPREALGTIARPVEPPAPRLPEAEGRLSRLDLLNAIVEESWYGDAPADEETVRAAEHESSRALAEGRR